MANCARRMLLSDTRDRWVAIRNLRHATEGEKRLAEIMIEECQAMLRELDTPVVLGAKTE